MADNPKNSPKDEPEIADAASLFGNEPKPSRPGSTPKPSPAPASPAPGEGTYDLEGGEPEEAPVVPPVPPPAAPARPRPKPGAEAEPRERKPSAPEGRVEQVWTRGAEWGSTIALLAIVGLIVLGLTYLTFSVENLVLPLLILLVGGAVWILLSYPIVITLERPVRMTPEQALKDYYGALSHHFPHYRRMWLLLSETGRTSSSYGSFDGFKSYWKSRLAELRGGRSPPALRWSFRSRTSSPRRAPARPRSTVSSPSRSSPGAAARTAPFMRPACRPGSSRDRTRCGISTTERSPASGRNQFRARPRNDRRGSSSKWHDRSERGGISVTFLERAAARPDVVDPERVFFSCSNRLESP